MIVHPQLPRFGLNVPGLPQNPRTSRGIGRVGYHRPWVWQRGLGQATLEGGFMLGGAVALTVLVLGVIAWGASKKGGGTRGLGTLADDTMSVTYSSGYTSGERIYLSRKRLDRQGYTSSGEYFGVGAPLYEFDAMGGPYGVLRANSRAEARAAILRRFPGAKVQK